MRKAKYHAVLACLFAFAVALAAGQEPALPQLPGAVPSQPQYKPVTAAQIAEWVKQLDAPEFLTRDTAMLALVEVGPPALEALRAVLTSGGLEAASRALYILRQLGATSDEKTQEAALAMLHQFAGRKETPAIARRAAATAEEVMQLRQDQALAELEKLGAKINALALADGIFDEQPNSIEIGEGFRGQARDLRRLARLPEISMLIFNGEKIDDEWLPYAAQMHNLEELHLYKTQVTEVGLRAFEGHPALMRLGVYYSPLEDSAMQELAKIPRLLFAKLYGTLITAKAAEDFAMRATAAKVDHKLGAFLGVGCIAAEGGCQIKTIHRGSPAEQAGLLMEDMIVRFGTEAIHDFDTLMNLIAQRHVGDSVDIEVVRQTLSDQGQDARKNVVVTVKFAAWDLEPAIRNSRR